MARPDAALPKTTKKQMQAEETQDLSITQSTGSVHSLMETTTNAPKDTNEDKIDAILMAVRQILKTTASLDQQIQLAKKAGKF